jgi:rhamnosyltransferase
MHESKIPSCAVLLAAYNGEVWLEEQINSILAQIGVQVAVFISVDLSTDATLEICERIANSDSRVTLLPHGSRFGGAGPNFYRLICDVEPEEFDMFAFSDQDDIWYETKLQTAWRHISLSGYDIFSSDVLAFWEDGRKELIKKSFPQAEFDYYFEAAGPGCTYVLSGPVYKSVRTFIASDVRECRKVELHDWLIYAYCRFQGCKWFIHDQPTVLYRQHMNNQVGTNNNFKAYLKRLIKLKNNWYSNEVRKLVFAVSGEQVDILFKNNHPVLNAYKFRRRPRDKWVFLFAYILGVFK